MTKTLPEDLKEGEEDKDTEEDSTNLLNIVENTLS